MRIVILAGKDISTTIIYNALKEKHQVAAVIIEQKVNKLVFLQKRIKKLGFITVAGQVLFQMVVVKYLDAVSIKRKEQIIRENQLSTAFIDPTVVSKVESVNDDSTIALLQDLAPDLVIVNGTRIISKKVLASVNSTFINAHAGITPAYRGVHGAYWAFANNDPGNAGVTVHFIDAGIDTGAIIYQQKTNIIKADNFTTYPFLQLADAVKLFDKVINDIASNTVVTKVNTSPGRLWSHPTIWGYIYNRLTKNVR